MRKKLIGISRLLASNRAALFIANNLVEYQPNLTLKLPSGKEVQYARHSSKRFEDLRRDLQNLSENPGVYLKGKEPETVDWIGRLDHTDVFWDIGANVGGYSLLAAIEYGAKVISFEPLASNFYALSQNIYLNRVAIGSAVSGYCLALDRDEISASFLNVRNFGIQSSGSSFGVPVDAFGSSYVPEFKQGSIGLSVDFLVEHLSLAPPTAMKIDVDGNEIKVLRGARNTLHRKSLRRVVVEVDLARENLSEEIQSILKGSGFGPGEVRGGNRYFGKHEIRNIFFERI
ncbi:MAG: FkbM family methyltransferase [Paracoccaceae bacterium]